MTNKAIIKPLYTLPIKTKAVLFSDTGQQGTETQQKGVSSVNFGLSGMEVSFQNYTFYHYLCNL